MKGKSKLRLNNKPRPKREQMQRAKGIMPMHKKG
jgi:hypothetical protein